MATRIFGQSLAVNGRSFLAAVSRPYATSSSVFLQNRYLFRLRPLVATSYASYFRRISPIRGFATRSTSSSLSDPNPNWSNRPPKETILLDGCDFEHWLVVMEKPEGDPTRDEIIDSYIKKLAEVVGSEEEARKKIYSVSTRHYYAFGALVSEELSYKLKELDKVRWVLPDSYLDVKNKDYGGEPFIDGQAVPYHPKYHEEWVRNNARANERNRRNDRPRQFDRSRNFERRRDPQMNQYSGGNNVTGQPNAPGTGPMQQNMPGMGGQPSYNNSIHQPAAPSPGSMQPNVGGQPNYMSQPAVPTPGTIQPPMGGQPFYSNNTSQPSAPTPGTVQPNMGGQPNYVPNMTPPPNAPFPGQVQTNVGGYPNSGPGGFPPNNAGYTPRGNAGGFSQPPPAYGTGQGYHAPNTTQNQRHNSYQGYAPPTVPNPYHPQDQNAPPQVQNVPTRD